MGARQHVAGLRYVGKCHARRCLTRFQDKPRLPAPVAPAHHFAPTPTPTATAVTLHTTERNKSAAPVPLPTWSRPVGKVAVVVIV